MRTRIMISRRNSLTTIHDNQVQKVPLCTTLDDLFQDTGWIFLLNNFEIGSVC